MNPSPSIATLWHHIRHTGLVLVFILLLALVGVAISSAHQTAVPTVRLMAPGDPTNPGPSSMATTKREIHVGS